jgi:hypothetical protein
MRGSQQQFDSSEAWMAVVGRPGLDSAGGSDLWFKGHPKEEFMNHSLATVQARARSARATRDHRIKSPL